MEDSINKREELLYEIGDLHSQVIFTLTEKFPEPHKSKYLNMMHDLNNKIFKTRDLTGNSSIEYPVILDEAKAFFGELMDIIKNSEKGGNY